MGEEDKIETRDKKWIKPGVAVAHRDFPERKMIAEQVIKATKMIVMPGKTQKEKHVITVGVDCHWFDQTGRYDRGRFLTMELIPFGAKQETAAPDPESFPKDIPSSENTLDTTNELADD